MQYVLGGSLHIKITQKSFAHGTVSWFNELDIHRLNANAPPTPPPPPQKKINCMMEFVKITNFLLDSFITSRDNKLAVWPAYNTLYFPV